MKTSRKTSLRSFALIQVVFLGALFLPTIWFGRRYALVLLVLYVGLFAVVLAGKGVGWLIDRVDVLLQRVQGPKPPP